ncbi:MAG: hypothetical protein EB015_22815, partial [Methylocystaceae bacterium]|nr:hypothetical protein [Methylocystaceae bacterium]
VSAQAARDRIAGRIDTLEKRMKENEIRFKERSIADRKSQSVEERAADKTKLLATARKQIQEEIDALRDDSLPENRGTIKMLEEELKALKSEAELSPSELDRIERQEVQDFVYNDEVVRQALEIAVGRRNRYEIPDFLQHIAENGGVADDGGDIMKALSGKNRVFSKREKSAQPQFEVNGKKSHPMYGSKKVDYSLITELNNSLNNPNTLEAWGQNFRSHNNERWNMVDENGQMVPLDKETVKEEIINAIDRGENSNPDWWNEGFKEHGINQLADSYIEAFKKMDAQPTSVREAVAAIRNGDTGAARRLRSMLDAAAQTGQAGESLVEAKLAYARGKKHLDDLLKRRGIQDAKVKGA